MTKAAAAGGYRTQNRDHEQSLQIYAIARGMARDMARDGRRSDIAAHVEFLRRDLGKRGRPRKK